MRDRGVDPLARFLIVIFMRVLIICVALLAGAIAGIASAGVRHDRAAVVTETPSVMAMRALITRCIPGASGGDVTTTGFRRTDASTEASLLGSRTGEVWTSPRARILLIDFADVPVCKVVAPKIDPAILADLVIRVFLEADGTFKRERFRFDEGGGFSAVYSNAKVVVRISAALGSHGSSFATLSAEATLP